MTATLASAADKLMSDYMDLKAGETVLITADTDGDEAVWRAIQEASLRAGATASVLLIPALPYQGRLADPYVTATTSAAVKACDVWIDVTFPYLAGSELHDEAMEAGHIRYLLGADLNSDGLLRLFGRVDLDRYFAVHHAFDHLVNEAVGKTVRITDKAGTDVSFTLGQRGFEKPRRASQPGTVLVPGSCTMFPDVETVKGTIEVGSVFHEYYTPLTAPMTIEVDGRIKAIHGGGNERSVADRALRRAGTDGGYGYIIHFTHGIHPAARVTGGSFIEDMRTQGNNAIGMGMPWWDPGGGENHPDAILYMHTVDIDGVRVVEDGEIVGPESLVALAADLEPLVG
tara:strand:+ start:1170 stop:2198 length:1029 start_codon:yes stop_codon:yes gene_type:complete